MDRQQFILFVEDVQKPVRRFLTALCLGDAARADDIAQDAFVRAFMAVDTLRDPDRFRSWIFRIAYTCYVSDCRSRRHTTELSDAEALSADTDRPDEVFRYQALYNALGQLSDSERSSVLLHYMHGYSVAEIASITGSTSLAVRQRLSRGRQHLKSLLSNDL